MSAFFALLIAASADAGVEIHLNGLPLGLTSVSEIQYLVPITIYALLQYCFLLFYLGNMNLKNKF